MGKKYRHKFNYSVFFAHKSLERTFGLLNNMFMCLWVEYATTKIWIVKPSHVPHKLIKILEQLLLELAIPSQQISQTVPVQAMQIMDGREY